MLLQVRQTLSLRSCYKTRSKRVYRLEVHKAKGFEMSGVIP